jgi:putative ABC transport system permease protein
MLYNYLKIAIRNIQRHVSYSLINILGLALGISCGLLIFSLVKHHLSFDDFHSKSDRIYRLVTEQHRDQVSYTWGTPAPLGKVFRDDYTFAEKVGRIFTFDEQLISIEENGQTKKFKDEVAFAETEFFDIFNYPLVNGNIQSALSAPGSALLTENIAKKYFGDEDPIGKTFRLDGRIDIKVTGILKDFPENTDRKTGIYISHPTLKSYNEWFASDDSWGGTSTSTQCFVRLKPGVTVEEVEAVMPAYVTKFRPTSKNIHHYKLQPLSDIHFNSRYGGAMGKRNLWVLSFIGFFLIITACVNFINLATAQAVHRSKEVGVRKVLGSVRKQLFWQFMTETTVITIFATVIAFTISYAALPYVNQWFNTDMNINLLNDWQLLLFVPLLITVVVLFSGFYPGFILSGFQPIAALKGKLSYQRIGGFSLRRSLIVTQFMISQVLIIGLIVIMYQMHYAKQSDMGFDRDAIVTVPVVSHDEKMKTLFNQFKQTPGVEEVSLCFSAPASTNSWRTSFRYDGRTEDEVFNISFRGADENYLSTFNIDLVAGRNLLPSDTVKEFLVNEAFVRKLNLSSLEEVIGHQILTNGGDWKAPVVGVFKDFHDFSFHSEINPVFISTADYNVYAIKITPTNMKNTLASLDKAWNAMYPEHLYEFHFVDDEIAKFYETEETLMNLIQAFSFIAILIGCMGLYGLVSFMAIQKNKEIGIRKVLGGNVSQILWIFGKEFVLLIGIAFTLAAPIGWWLMNRWLQDFQYKVTINVWVFAAAIGITASIALLTVCYRSLRAALVNPVNSLRSE